MPLGWALLLPSCQSSWGGKRGFAVPIHHPTETELDYLLIIGYYIVWTSHVSNCIIRAWGPRQSKLIGKWSSLVPRVVLSKIESRSSLNHDKQKSVILKIESNHSISWSGIRKLGSWSVTLRSCCRKRIKMVRPGVGFRTVIRESGNICVGSIDAKETSVCC